MRSLWPQQVWRYFKAVQHAFYADAPQRGQTRRCSPTWPATSASREPSSRKAFASQKMRELTLQADFQQSQQWGIRGFPALVAEHGDHLHLVGRASCRSTRCASGSPRRPPLTIITTEGLRTT